MTLARYHRRLAILMAGTSLLAFAGGAGFEPLPAVLATLGLLLGFFWSPSERTGVWMERMWIPLALIFVARALIHVFVIRDDVVIPVVDLLLLLLVAEALRTEDARNEPRIYALAFALLLASTAYRPGLLFGFAFVGFVVLGTMTLTVGHLRSQAHRHGHPPVPMGRGLVVGSLAVTVAALLMSAVVFLTFPRVSQGWAARALPTAGSMAGFSDQVSLGSHGSTIFANPEIVLRVEFQGDLPANPGALYWRGRSYDRFDGVRWTRTRNPPAALATSDWYRNRWGQPVLDYKVYAAALDTRVLFALHPLLGVDPQAGITPIVDNVGDFQYWGSGTPTYVAHSQGGRPHPDSLRAAERGWIPGRQLYLQLPSDLPARIGELADSLVGALPTRYDRAVALENWFHDEFTYTRDLPPTSRETGLDHFLFDRRAGHCEYFSTAMVIMLRSQGIAAREVNGFMGGQWNDFGQFLAVTQNEAHAWVEVWFPGHGWVPFDPTPAGGLAAAASTAWLWPGRVLFDGMSHRWGKWVLDYSFEQQSGLLDRLADAMAPDEDEAASRDLSGDSSGLLSLMNGPLAMLAAVVLLLLLFRALRRSRATPVPEVTALYLKARTLIEARSDRPATSLPPLAWVRRLERESAVGWQEARAIVDRYLAVRFGTAPWGPEARAAMTTDLNRVRTALKQRPARG